MRSCNMLKNSRVWELLSFWADVIVQHFIVSDSSDCFIIKSNMDVPRSFAHGAPQTATFSLCNSCLWISLGHPVSLTRVFRLFTIQRCERNIHQKSQSHVRNWNRTNDCSYKIAGRKLLENSFVVVFDVLLLYCSETLELAFSGCCVWWSKKL